MAKTPESFVLLVAAKSSIGIGGSESGGNAVY